MAPHVLLGMLIALQGVLHVLLSVVCPRLSVGVGMRCRLQRKEEFPFQTLTAAKA